MTSVISRVKNSVSHAGASSMSPSGRRERRTSKAAERVIPPEPVQQQPDGELTSTEASPALTAHNLARANKMVPKLSWDDRLAHDAESYAKILASTGKLEHSGNEVQGENLYMTTAEDAKFEDAIGQWMNEEKNYHGEKIGEGDLQATGHFTQCLWHSTTHVGMGKAKSGSGKTYIVARYSPRGNIQGGKPF
ncbi:uncharacterized protein LTR77_004880 [Saxophila tyrrhenica]|uniref:SCP domain-containing protein n=1 Tax=Saxophila tyrrhenica TaxID=1690608 RepID=A0AAV9PB44_9PEZI|nr:hypothetical protein LTR77_004880 [Saxophila tyrrhenica]